MWFLREGGKEKQSEGWSHRDESRNGQMWAWPQFIFVYMYTCKCVGMYVVFVYIRS